MANCSGIFDFFLFLWFFNCFSIVVVEPFLVFWVVFLFFNTSSMNLEGLLCLAYDLARWLSVSVRELH